MSDIVSYSLPVELLNYTIVDRRYDMLYLYTDQRQIFWFHPRSYL